MGAVMTTEAQAYVAGWQACMAGVDGRYASESSSKAENSYAWIHGWLDAMEAEDSEEPQPDCAGYGDWQ
jgi:isocitrate lyase